MGLIKRNLLDKIFQPKQLKSELTEQFKLLNGYAPVFSTHNGGIYEMELTRSAIHAKARLIGKLKPEIKGNAFKTLEKALQYKPNDFMNTYQFLYRVSTILDVNTSCFIIPIIDRDGYTVKGFYPLNPTRTELIKDGSNNLYARYHFANGVKATIEWSKVGVVYKHSYDNELWGDGNDALKPTMSVINIQNQGMIEAVKSSATIRFMGKLATTMRSEDITAERDRFTKENLSYENKSQMLLFDNKYEDIRQVDSKPYLVDPEQMESIKQNVYSYFGVSEGILQSNYTEDEFNAFYESEIESFALQLGLTLTNMLFSPRELAHGNEVIFTANRLQYASNKTKLQVINSGLDRGWLNQNEAREIMQLAGIGETGDVYRIRLDFTETDKLNDVKGVAEYAETEE